MEKDLQSLIDQGSSSNLTIKVSSSSFDLSWEVPKEQQSNQYIVTAMLNRQFVRDCPLFIDFNVDDSNLKSLNVQGDVTRTGKSTADLDNSDMVAMGYVNKTMLEEGQAKSRNVSFNQIITIQ